MSKILTVATQMAPYQYETPEIIEQMDHLWLSKLDETTRRTAIMLLKASQIDSRASVLPLEQVFSDADFETRNNLYEKVTVDLGKKVLKKALEQAKLQPKDIDVIISVSCTGFMIPSMDAYLVEELGMRGDILRLPVTEMGCAGGTSALIYAHQFIKANPKAKVAIVSVETPSLTFQKDDLSMENLVSTALFADGASCVILGHSDQLRPQIVDTDMYHFPKSTHLMGYKLRNSGLKIVLDRDVPDAINEHFQKILLPFLDRNRLQPQQIQNYMFHPGGKKIINRTEEYISQFKKDISDSKEVLREHGNMSSSTIFFILDRFMKKEITAEEYGYMLAFGPGFMAQSLLVQWR